LGNEVEERKYWEEGEKKVCRLCGGGEMETWEHIWEGCRKWMVGDGSWQEDVLWVLGEEGEGEDWMRKLQEEREKMKGIEVGRGRREEE